MKFLFRNINFNQFLHTEIIFLIILPLYMICSIMYIMFFILFNDNINRLQITNNKYLLSNISQVF